MKLWGEIGSIGSCILLLIMGIKPNSNHQTSAHNVENVEMLKCWNVGNVEMLEMLKCWKCWNVEMLKMLKCWNVENHNHNYEIMK